MVTNNNTRAVVCKFEVGGEPVKIVNGSELIKYLVPDGNITSKDTPGDCVMVISFMEKVDCKIIFFLNFRCYFIQNIAHFQVWQPLISMPYQEPFLTSDF